MAKVWIWNHAQFYLNILLFIPTNVIVRHMSTSSWLYHGSKNTMPRTFVLSRFSYGGKISFDNALDELVPIQLLICHAVNCEIKYENQTVCLVCPVQNIPQSFRVRDPWSREEIE